MVFIAEDKVLLASNKDSGQLALTHEEWADFLTDVRSGKYDL